MSNLVNKTILVTGAAGFIGSSLIHAMLKEPTCFIVGVDNLNEYYDPELKIRRLRRLDSERFRFAKCDIADEERMEALFTEYHPDIVVNLAAQAGVRYSIDHPESYIISNINGFFCLLELCRKYPPAHFVYASSSSVYGDGDVYPLSEDMRTDTPVSLYAATKKTDEIMAYAYAKLYGIPVTGLRFFTVYGPWGRPDMAYYSFAEQLIKGGTIKLFNYGECKRDFTYIDDITEGLCRILSFPPQGAVPYEIYNIGKGRPDELMDFVQILYEELVRAHALSEGFRLSEHIQYLPMQKGDVRVTYADTTKLEQAVDYRPGTDLRKGLRAFCEWYAAYRKEQF